MNEVLIFILGLVLAAFFCGAIGVACWHREKIARVRVEAEYSMLSEKLDVLEEQQASAEKLIEEKDGQVQRLVAQLHEAGAYINKLQMILQQQGHGPQGIMLFGACQQPPQPEKRKEPGEDFEDGDGEGGGDEPSITGNN